MTARLATIAQLRAMGFTIEHEGRNVIMRRGNDYRLIQQDGTQKRAMGARR